MNFKAILLICISILIQVKLIGQTKKEERFNKMEYTAVIKGYENKLAKNPDDFETHHRLAIAYYKTGEIQQSYKHFRYLVISDYVNLQPSDWNIYGQYSLTFGEILDATRAFNKIAKFNPKATVQKHPANNTIYKATNIAELNSRFSDFSPVLYNDQLVFASDRPVSLYDFNQSNWTGTAYLSIFKMDTSKKNEPVLFSKKINDTYHLGPISFSADGKTVYLTKSSKDDKSQLNQTHIYLAEFKQGKRNKMTPFEFATDKKYSFAHPVYIPNLKMLVFSSNIEGGQGEMDLYYSKYENNKWLEPISFGEKVNTPFNDVFPCYNPFRPNSVFFSSNGYIGFGGLDIYETSFNNGSWTVPTLLPKAINSNFDDFGICFSRENEGYVSSNRNGGKGKDDIYSFKQVENTFIEGILVDGVEHKPLPNKMLYLVNEKGVVFDSVFSDNKGYFIYTKLPFQNISLMPLNENGAEMIIRPLYDFYGRDPFLNIKLLSSSKILLDSIGLLQTEMVTYVLESAEQVKKRCLVYENGDHAALVIINVKNKDGKTIDQLTTDNEGCFTIKKLYSETSYLELLDEMKTELQMRFMNQKDEKNTNWQKEKESIEITTMKRCVIYENGTEAVQINFAVKDSTGAIIDLITTDEMGCFKIRKLYNQKTYLALLENEMTEMGLRFKNQNQSDNFYWYKDEEKIVLVSGLMCVEYSDGSRAKTVKFEVKDSTGTTYDYVTTDDNGCFKMRKLYSDNSYLQLLVEEDTYLRSNLINSKSKTALVLTQYTTKPTVELTGRVYDYNKLNKDFSGLEVIFLSENGMVLNTSKVSQNGSFSYAKLPSQNMVLMLIQDKEGVLQGSKGITVKGQVTNVKQFIKVNNTTVYVVDANNEKFKASKLSSSGAFQFDIKIEDYELVARPKESTSFEQIKPSDQSQIVIKNIYFDSKMWELDAEGKKVLDELAILLKTNATLTLKIYAHTDSRGKTSDNLELSNLRATSVANYLKAKQVPSTQFSSKGCGESKIINQCINQVECSDEDHAKNRRIEFEFIWKK